MTDRYCSCDFRLNTKYCRGYSHECVCEDENLKCRASVHICRCDQKCRAKVHDCICNTYDPKDCKAQEHTCGCCGDYNTKYCKATIHYCVCNDKNAKCRSYKHNNINK